jgi:GntR family transcriptional regulator
MIYYKKSALFSGDTMENSFLKLEKVNEVSPTPLYYQVAESIQKLIEEEKIEPGTKLPSEESLARYFGVSRPTISNAIDLLIKKSLVYRDRGKGTFVQDKKIQLPLLQEPISFGEALKKAGVSFYTEVLELKKIKANKSIAEGLDLRTGSALVYLKRLRYINNEPFLLTKSYLPSDLFPGLLEIDFTKFSLFSILNQKYHTSAMKVERYMKIIRASEDEARFLKMPIGDPLLQMEGIAFSSQDRKIECFDIKIKSEKIVFFTTLHSDK